MGELYYGSTESGMKRIEPQKSTLGTFIYATPYKELAIILSGKCGDNLTYTLYMDEKSNKWKLVERIPMAFDLMYCNEASLYTLSDETFKVGGTELVEAMSGVGVNVNNEMHIKNVYEAIQALSSQGKVEIYRYPTRPEKIPQDDSDLIKQVIKDSATNGKSIQKKDLKRVLFLHPNLINRINDILLENNQEAYRISELINIFEEYLVRQMLTPSKEQYIKSFLASIAIYYPELMSLMEEKGRILESDNSSKINFIVNVIERKLSDFPRELIERIKGFYLTTGKTYSEICQEIKAQIRRLTKMEKLVSRKIPQDILDDSIIIIGPRGAGKSTISNELSKLLKMPKVSLDDRRGLQEFYSKRKMFSNLKDFEFFLSCSVLTGLKEPTIIDFGAGHSVYENPIMFYEFQKIINKFSNVIYMIPSEDREESLEILNNRVLQRNPNEHLSQLNSNRHFVNAQCNDRLFTMKILTKDKSIKDICEEIAAQVQEKKSSDERSPEIKYH